MKLTEIQGYELKLAQYLKDKAEQISQKLLTGAIEKIKTTVKKLYGTDVKLENTKPVAYVSGQHRTHHEMDRGHVRDRAGDVYFRLDNKTADKLVSDVGVWRHSGKQVLVGIGCIIKLEVEIPGKRLNLRDELDRAIDEPTISFNDVDIPFLYKLHEKPHLLYKHENGKYKVNVLVSKTFSKEEFEKA